MNTDIAIAAPIAAPIAAVSDIEADFEIGSDVETLRRQLEDVAAGVKRLRRHSTAENGDSANELAGRLETIVAGLRKHESSTRIAVHEAETNVREVAEFRNQWRELVGMIPGGHLVSDPAGIVLEANPYAAKLFGSPREFLIGKPIAMYVAREQWGQFYAYLAALSRNQQNGVERAIFRLRPQNGRTAAISVAAVPVNENHRRGRLLRWSFIDFTEHLRAQEELDAARLFSDVLFHTAPIFILVLDDAGRILRINAQTRTTLEVVHGELTDEPWWSILAEPDRPRVEHAFLEAVQSTRTQRVNARIQRDDGPTRSVAWVVKRLPHPTARSHAIAVGHDISDIEDAQNKAIQAERLAAIGQMMTMLAHESRNSLQRTQACLERLRWRLADRPEELDLVQRVQIAQRDLTRLFDDVRHFTAPLQLRLERADLSEIWREAWSKATAVRSHSDGQLQDEQCFDVDCVCTVDRFRMEQGFRNLFDNAFESATGTLVVRILCRAEADALEIRVRDNGPGFGAEVAQRIFEPFFTTKPKGSGLGMAITKRILDSHGGKIEVLGSNNSGAEFLLVVPRSSS